MFPRSCRICKKYAVKLVCNTHCFQQNNFDASSAASTITDAPGSRLRYFLPDLQLPSQLQGLSSRHSSSLEHLSRLQHHCLFSAAAWRHTSLDAATLDCSHHSYCCAWEVTRLLSDTLIVPVIYLLSLPFGQYQIIMLGDRGRSEQYIWVRAQSRYVNAEWSDLSYDC